MAELRAIFFDVGNTLLFPNRDKMLGPLRSAHLSSAHPTLEQWQALERRTKHEFDLAMESGPVNFGFWWTFHTHLLEQLGEDLKVREALVRNTGNSALWDQILPGTCDVLDRIAQRFRIAVISNADGKVDRVLSRCGIADRFESITDSGNVGFEKPRREIFEAALATMNVPAHESLYVGDVYSVDYLGARNAGMQAILLDVAGAYRERDLPRVDSLGQLESWLPQ